LKIKGIYFLYRVLQAFGLPVLLLYFLFRAVRNRRYWPSLTERFGFLPRSFKQTGPGAIWLHAVSVGEVLTCAGYVRRLRAEFPHSPVFVSTTTLAGHDAALQKLQGIAGGVFFAPVDTVWAVRRVLRTLQPSAVVVAETEIWPNLFRETKRTGAALVLVNGRISDRALPRYRRLAGLFRAVLPQVDAVLAQSPEMAERFRQLGAPVERVRDAGNFKFDFEAHAAEPGSPVLAWAAGARVWIAASTMPPAETGDPDEDDAVIAAFAELRRSHPELRLILVPRKPERFDAAARKLEAAGMAYVRRSTMQGSGPVLLLDTIGELSGLFGAADVVFMGGTLARRGGHNILEPALFAKPVIVGPHMENFQAIADEFRAAGACAEIADAGDLAGAVARLLDSPDAAAEIGGRAKACAEARRGATARAVEAVRRLYDAGVPAYRMAQPWYAAAWALARIWKWGSLRRQNRQVAQQRALDVPVISIGNITMGGTGKTPCVLRLAELLRAAGHRPGILTRGYGRGSPESHLILAPGALMRAEHTGDEPQIFVRSGLAPVGIGADRYQAGNALILGFGPDLMLLDDGMQHRKLARDLDVVLIDALKPFGGGNLFPLGRLREPLEGLARAGAVVITRSAFSDLTPAIVNTLRRYNRDAPVFRAGVQPAVWVDPANGRECPAVEPPFERAGMFCGLGNPLAFRRTLESIGVIPLDVVEFPDHHRYRPQELQRVAEQVAARGAEALVTTEKDVVNLCEDWEALIAPLRLYWLKVEMEIEREQELLAMVLKFTSRSSARLPQGPVHS
jgi:3-deoxy-D-manno-octulosonic-acid transferase